MNNRISQKLIELRNQKRKALSIFITAGYPTLDATPHIVKALGESGADIVELGIPFSDPLADGPIIQQSSDVAIKNGVNLSLIFKMVQEIRKDSDIGIVLMGYVNPIMAYGMQKFMEHAASCGVDGLIVPDIPVEESAEYRRLAIRNNLSTIFLAAPTTSDERLNEIDTASSGFVYCVSITGVTGSRNGLPDNVKYYLQRCKKCITKNPLLVGFGITSPEDARTLTPYVDGIIIGSALIKRINGSLTGDYISAIKDFTVEIRNGLDSE